uniref:Protein kinase domain-containing protein n=1 Tax=Oryza barthii TaxID=65489 RepID=A0A0D3G3R0_9ORYZ
MASRSPAAMVMACVVVVLRVSCVLAVDEQGAALLAWKATLRGGGGALADWKAGDASPCRWTGVTCNADGGVTELSLEFVDLFGGVPGNLAAAVGRTLTRLVLTGANLTGPIPPELGELPALAHLDLSNNALTGTIPAALCRPGSKLETLYLNSNRLEGAIPDTIGNLTSLRELIVYDNQLAGKIPASIGKMSSLEVLRGGGNKNLQGALPAEIGDCSSLTMIGLAETSITGPLPASLGRLKNLTTLAIYTALLSGPIPPELGRCGTRWIIHRDVKADNILLGDRYEACLADFGLARVADDGASSSPPPFAGSYGYIAPEYGCMTKITTKSDVYSFGVVLLEMITGRRPLDPAFGEGQSVVQWVRDHLCRKRDPAEIIDVRLQGRPDTQVQEMLQALGIALLCASPRPEDRPTMKDVAALLRGIRHDDGVEARKAGNGVGTDAETRKRADPRQPISPTKLMALARPAQAQAQAQLQARANSGSLGLLNDQE